VLAFLLGQKKRVDVEHLVFEDLDDFTFLVLDKLKTGNLLALGKGAMISDALRRLVDHLVLLARLAVVLDHVESILVHLLDYQLHRAHAPDVIRVPHVHFGVNFEFGNLSLFVILCLVSLSLVPVVLNRLVFAVIDQLVDDVVDFETHAEGPFSDYVPLHAVKVAHEAGLKRKDARVNN